MMSTQVLQRRQARTQRVFVSDCEGPISKNDNAFELSMHFIPNGNEFFALVSKYDDILADMVKKPGYKAGDTLRLILPFLKAYGATNRGIKEYSAEHILLVPGAGETLRFVGNTMPSFIVSTSYEQYIYSLCDLTGFPHGNVYCTQLNLDKYKMAEKERNRLRKLGEKISAMPMIKIPETARYLQDLSQEDRETVKRLDKIFWEEIPRMESGRMLEDVNPVGGYEKANAVRDIVGRLDTGLGDVMYVGDSITDVSPFRLVRRNGGLTVSFNGNRYAVREAEIAVLSDHTLATSILADTFNKHGKEGVFQLVEEWSHRALERYADPTLRKSVLERWPTRLPQVEAIRDENRERLSSESSAFRRTVRGEAVGRLG